MRMIENIIRFSWKRIRMDSSHPGPSREEVQVEITSQIYDGLKFMMEMRNDFYQDLMY
jgi:hypothetical protein